MNKAELIADVAERAGVTKTQAAEIVDAVFDAMAGVLLKGDDVRVPSFGTFDVVPTAPRKARNPQTGEELDVPAGRKARFKPGKALKDALNGAAPAAPTKR